MARRRPTDPYRAGLDGTRAAAFDRLADLLGQHDRTLPDYLACGREIAALEPADVGYGSGWVKAVCEALGRQQINLSLTLAYRLLRFADMFPGPGGSADV